MSLRPDVVAFTAVASAHASAGDVSSVMRIFRTMEGAGVQPNIFSWTAIIMACGNARPRRAREAEQAFRSMLQNGVAPDHIFIRKLDKVVGVDRRLEMCKFLGVDDVSLMTRT